MSDKDEILKTMLTLHGATEMRFNALERDMRDGFGAQETRIERVEREMRDGFGAVNARLDRLERRRGPRGGDRP